MRIRSAENYLYFMFLYFCPKSIETTKQKYTEGRPSNVIIMFIESHCNFGITLFI